MSAAEAVCDEFLGVVAHAEGTGFVEAGAGRVNFAGA